MICAVELFESRTIYVVVGVVLATGVYLGSLMQVCLNN